MIKDKKILFAIIGLITTIAIFAIAFFLSTTKSKDLVQTINKVYLAYSSYVIDLGHSPENIADLYKNQNNIARWNGPYISKTILDNYNKDSIKIIQASSIPTKKCSLDYLTNCYKWIKVSGLDSADFEKVKESINPKSGIFFANNNLFFKLSNIE